MRPEISDPELEASARRLEASQKKLHDQTIALCKFVGAVKAITSLAEIDGKYPSDLLIAQYEEHFRSLRNEITGLYAKCGWEIA
jgi:hypothetical protein